jgi:hypothetical protein
MRELAEAILATGLPGALAACAGRLNVVSIVVSTATTTNKIRLVLGTTGPRSMCPPMNSLSRYLKRGPVNSKKARLPKQPSPFVKSVN